MRRLICSVGSAIIVVFSGAVALPAAAQPTEIEFPADETWEHDWSAMEFPPQIGTFERTRLSEFEPRQTNIAANYFEQSTGTYLTIYIYRPGNPIAPVWFDRALMAIGLRDERYGQVDLDDLKIASFTPKGGNIASGQYAITKVDGRFKSTGVAIYQAGEWLVKLRISSQRLIVGEMETLTQLTLENLPALENVSQQAAYFVEQCDEEMQFGKAEPVKTKGADALNVITLSAILKTPINENRIEQSTLCREGARQAQFNIFRPTRGKAGYFIAIGDAGSSIEVLSLAGVGEAMEMHIPANFHSVKSFDGLRTNYHTPFSGLPNPRQVGEAYQSAPFATSGRKLGDEEEPPIELFMGDD